MQSEGDFIALDSVMVMLATAALTVAHPGYCFPRLGDSFAKKERKGEEKNAGSGSEEDLA